MLVGSVPGLDGYTRLGIATVSSFEGSASYNLTVQGGFQEAYNATVFNPDSFG